MVRWLIYPWLLLGSIGTHAYTLTLVTENFAHFQYINGEGELVGHAADKVVKVLNEANVDYQLSVDNWSTSYNSAKRDPNTCIFSIAKSKHRDALFSWVFPIGGFTTSFYALKTANIRIEDLEQARQYKIAVIRDNFSHQYLKSHGFSEGQQLLLIQSFDKIFQLLATRRDIVDLVILSDAQFEHKSKSEPMSSELERVMTLNQMNTRLYFACNKKVPQSVIKRIKAAYDRLY
ncbi:MULTISPECIES: transporter substrate-binding domain-containing protein [unclassified Pseudoalteromonas]|uniref:substrate-binding periplasmic protein n=1 Tax=unclassified Pseudoalteromonas TaxID=194690 RepID=UPI0020975ADF|nr:transporter substrate-binding domain-containing protein [Pseudoalteromonas sp. XMcav2-N]MCO7190507.1 transporter substrate-binding domain-containing protein [Pseudoalteromonas sp. XMcav2-N]